MRFSSLVGIGVVIVILFATGVRNKWDAGAASISVLLVYGIGVQDGASRAKAKIYSRLNSAKEGMYGDGSSQGS